VKQDDFTTAGGLLYLVNTNEGKNFKSIALADQVLKDRRYLITKHYFFSKIADGTFQTWSNLLNTEEGIFLDFCEEIDLLARQVWNYSYFKTSFAADDFRLDTTLACVFNNPPYLGDWNIRCPIHTQGGDLGFAWHITHTSKQIYTISRLTTELCPSFLPQGIEKQYFSDVPLLLQWREFDFIYQELCKKGLITEVPDMIVPKNYGKSLHSFAIVILCKA
jgi:hypothetical protein